jgi:hypothetical protein
MLEPRLLLLRAMLNVSNARCAGFTMDYVVLGLAHWVVAARCSVFTMDSAVLGLAPLGFTPLLRMKCCHACNQCQPIRESTNPLTVVAINCVKH